MSVNTFLLDRRSVTLLIGDTRQTVGTLRRFFKVTELDEKRAAELTAGSGGRPSPLAVMLVDVNEFPRIGDPNATPVAAHLVLGWDEGRGSVTDFGWDYLPKLGYAVRDPTSGDYVLHEERAGGLQAIDGRRARELGLIDDSGHLVPHGQPRIVGCWSVKPWSTDYAEAECTFDNGNGDTILTLTPEGQIPPEEWFIGKRPMDVQRYPGGPTGPAS